MDEMIMALVIIAIFAILVFLITRWFWCRYWKINARLNEQQRTNELLQNIYDALVQGNTVSAVTAGHLVQNANQQRDNLYAAAPPDIREEDIPNI